MTFPLWELRHLVEPSCILLVATATAVVVGGAYRALSHERNSGWRDRAESAVTLDKRQALLVPIASSCSLLLLFYFFSAISQLLVISSCVISAASFVFAAQPVVSKAASLLGLNEAWQTHRSQLLLVALSIGIALSWLVTGHWVLNNVLGISLCIGFMSHIRLPNMKVCTLLLCALFLYDVFWVFLSARVFGDNVMVSVATRRGANPIHTLSRSLHVPLSQVYVTGQLDIPVKLMFPRLLFSHLAANPAGAEPPGGFLILGLGDMALPGMLLALALCFDHRKKRDAEAEEEGYTASAGASSHGAGYESTIRLESVVLATGTQASHHAGLLDRHASGSKLTQMGGAAGGSVTGASSSPTSAQQALPMSSGGIGAGTHPTGLGSWFTPSYMGCTCVGYTVGLLAALAAGILTRSPQPALMYLVPMTLLPLGALGYARSELRELWDGPRPILFVPKPGMEEP